MINIEALLEDLNTNGFEIYNNTIDSNLLTLRFEELVNENEEETVIEILNRNNIKGFNTFSINGLGSTTLTSSF